MLVRRRRVDVRLLVCCRVALLVLRVLDEDAQVLRELLELLQVLARARAGGLVAVVEELVRVAFDVLHAAGELLVLLHRWGVGGRAGPSVRPVGRSGGRAGGRAVAGRAFAEWRGSRRAGGWWGGARMGL